MDPALASWPIGNLNNNNLPGHHYGDSIAPPPPSDLLIPQGYQPFQFPNQNIPLQSVQLEHSTSANIFPGGINPSDNTQTDTIINPATAANPDRMNDEAWRQLARESRERNKRKLSEDSDEQQEGKL